MTAVLLRQELREDDVIYLLKATISSRTLYGGVIENARWSELIEATICKEIAPIVLKEFKFMFLLQERYV